MIEYAIFTCDTNHANHSAYRAHANDIDTAAKNAVRDCPDSRFVVAVIEADHTGTIAGFVGATDLDY